MTLKYGQSYWKWYEQVKLNEKYHHAKFHIYDIYDVWENPNFKVFDKPRHLTYQKHHHLPWKHTKFTSIILCVIFLRYVATVHC